MNWKTIPGFSRYEVSEDGQVRCVRPIGAGKVGPRSAHRRRGYLRVRLTGDDGHTRNLSVHRAVALAHLPPPPSPEHTDVAHEDGSTDNNHFENLRWSTRSENMLDKNRHGTATRGESHPDAKLTEDQALQILASDEPHPVLAERFRVSSYTVWSVRRGKTWKHLDRPKRAA